MIARLVCSGNSCLHSRIASSSSDGKASPLRRHEDRRCSRSLPGLKCSTDALHVTQTSFRVGTEPNVEKWETCNNEIDQASERCQHKSSKFFPSRAHKKWRFSKDCQVVNTDVLRRACDPGGSIFFFRVQFLDCASLAAHESCQHGLIRCLDVLRHTDARATAVGTTSLGDSPMTQSLSVLFVHEIRQTSNSHIYNENADANRGRRKI